MLTPIRHSATPALRGLVMLLAVLAVFLSTPATPGPAGSPHDPLIDRVILGAQAVLDRAPPAPAPAPEGCAGGVALLTDPPSPPARWGASFIVMPVAGHAHLQGRFSHGGARAPPDLLC